MEVEDLEIANVLEKSFVYPHRHWYLLFKVISNKHKQYNSCLEGIVPRCINNASTVISLEFTIRWGDTHKIIESNGKKTFIET